MSGELSAVREARRDALFTLAVDSPEGVTVADMMAALEATHAQVKVAIRDLRLFLGEFDECNFPCDPSDQGQWVYRLVGTYDDARQWMANRLGDGEARLRTMNAMMASMVAGSDGRTIEGRKARVIETGLRHLVEDLDNLALLVE